MPRAKPASNRSPVGHAPLLLLALLGTGCTMCPDPFDYSGPVPNGSVTQNDFAARSNGIIPVRSTPLPWPPIVDARTPRPTPADETDGAMLAVSEEHPNSAAENGATESGDAVEAVMVATAAASPDAPPEILPDSPPDAAAPAAATPPQQARSGVTGAPPARRRTRPDAGISEKPSWREAARSLFSL